MNWEPIVSRFKMTFRPETRMSYFDQNQIETLVNAVVRLAFPGGCVVLQREAPQLHIFANDSSEARFLVQFNAAIRLQINLSKDACVVLRHVSYPGNVLPPIERAVGLIRIDTNENDGTMSWSIPGMITATQRTKPWYKKRGKEVFIPAEIAAMFLSSRMEEWHGARPANRHTDDPMYTRVRAQQGMPIHLKDVLCGTKQPKQKPQPPKASPSPEPHTKKGTLAHRLVEVVNRDIRVTTTGSLTDRLTVKASEVPVEQLIEITTEVGTDQVADSGVGQPAENIETGPILDTDTVFDATVLEPTVANEASPITHTDLSSNVLITTKTIHTRNDSPESTPPKQPKQEENEMPWATIYERQFTRQEATEWLNNQPTDMRDTTIERQLRKFLQSTYTWIMVRFTWFEKYYVITRSRNLDQRATLMEVDGTKEVAHGPQGE